MQKTNDLGSCFRKITEIQVKQLIFKPDFAMVGTKEEDSSDSRSVRGIFNILYEELEKKNSKYNQFK